MTNGDILQRSAAAVLKWIVGIIYSVSTKKTPPKYNGVVGPIRNTWQTSLKFLQQNLAHICTMYIVCKNS